MALKNKKSSGRLPTTKAGMIKMFKAVGRSKKNLDLQIMKVAQRLELFRKVDGLCVDPENRANKVLKSK